MFFARREESIKRKRVFAYMGVDEQSDFRVEFAERGICRERNLNDVADATNIHENLVRSFVGEATAKLANHRGSVLPRCGQVSNLLVQLKRGNAEGLSWIFSIHTGLRNSLAIMLVDFRPDALHLLAGISTPPLNGRLFLCRSVHFRRGETRIV